MARYRCTVCNWVYDEDKEGKKFADQPDSYTCPNCGAPKTAFVPEGVIRGDAGITTTVADKIVEQLVSFGVRHIYGIPGDSNLPLIEALRRSGKIRFILTRHEETAAFMACARGKMTDKLGVCISIAGPGSTNLITGLIDAAEDRSPVLALLGQIPEVYLGSEAFQEIDELELFHPFSDFAETIARSNQALKLVTMGVKYAYKTPGVAVISMPTDVLVEKLEQPIFLPGMRLAKSTPGPRDIDIDRAVYLVNESKRPAIIAGWGTRHYGADLLEFADKIKAPIATTSRAKGIIHETHRSCLGVLGSLGSQHAARAIQSADMVLVLGSGFRHANLVPVGVKMVQVDRDPVRIGRTFDITVGIAGDTGVVLSRLLPRIEKKEKDTAYWETIKKMQAAHIHEVRIDAEDKSKPINPGYVIQALKRKISREAVICVDVGDHTYWFFKKFMCEGEQVFLSANIASMGFGLPAALCAQLSFPDRQVVCLAGDGGFAMLASDFTTAVREKLPITVIVFNDGRLKNISKEQKRDGYPVFGVDFPNPDFAGFAESCGGEGFRVEEPEHLDPALQRALASKKPCVVEVLVDPEKLAASGKKID